MMIGSRLLGVLVIALSVLASPVAAQQQPAAQTAFDFLDLDNDGQVTREEAKRRAVINFIRLDVDSDTLLTIDEFAVESPNADIDAIAQAFVELDGNGDGFLTPQEFSLRGSAMFVFIDRDEDGILTSLEMEQAKERMRIGLRQMRDQQAGQ